MSNLLSGGARYSSLKAHWFSAKQAEISVSSNQFCLKYAGKFEMYRLSWRYEVRKLILNASILGIVAVLPHTSVLADANESELVKVRIVDFSGRPPFKREIVELPAADVARMEAMDEVVEMERVWTVDYRGKPPFKRQFEDVPVIDIASMEMTAENSKQKSSSTPFKRHR